MYSLTLFIYQFYKTYLTESNFELVTLFQLFHNFKCLAEGPGSLKKSILLINSLLEFTLLFNERGIIS